MPNTTFLPPRLAGLMRPGALAAALSTGFEGALSLVWKSSLVAGLLVGSAPHVDFFFGGEVMRDGPSWLDVGSDIGVGAGSLLTAFLRGIALGLAVVVVVSTNGAIGVSAGGKAGTSRALPGVAIFDRLDCFGLSAAGVGTIGSSKIAGAAEVLPVFEAVLGALSFLILGLLGVSAAGGGPGIASSLSFSSTKSGGGACNFGAVLESPSSKSCTSGSFGAS